jgi:hypothetical protein
VLTDYALTSEGILRDLLDFIMGTEIISNHMPLTTRIRSKVDLEEIRHLLTCGKANTEV